MLKYKSMQAMCEACKEKNISMSEMVLLDQAEQMGMDKEVLYQKMKEQLDVMRQAIAKGMDKNVRSVSGLTGGDAAKMWEYSLGGGILGGLSNRSIARAIAVAEYNASMGKIVAAPTAGSCGILPGTVISVLEEGLCTEKEAVMALFLAGAVGMVIANQASLAGAEGGCQAECGSASAMAAAALVELFGGTPEQMCDACAIAIKNQLGLVCDPVAGLVEIPCIKRNVSGIMIAFSSAEMALAGISSKIPVDECILAMRRVGDDMDTEYKETARGGLAATPTGQSLRKSVFGK